VGGLWSVVYLEVSVWACREGRYKDDDIIMFFIYQNLNQYIEYLSFGSGEILSISPLTTTLDSAGFGGWIHKN
jgi:hypothetical protein